MSLVIHRELFLHLISRGNNIEQTTIPQYSSLLHSYAVHKKQEHNKATDAVS